MTIKKRLFISNILMIAIPYVISTLTVWSSIFVVGLLLNGEDVLESGRRGLIAMSDYGGRAMLVSAVVLAFLFAVLIMTNRFLTKFVFKKIEQPLEMLSGGVRHISDGDLDYRIAYEANDEFKPICEAFNEMAGRLKVSIAEVRKNEQHRKELFVGISHDLRSPLTSIKAFVEGLLDGVANTPEAQHEYLLTIKQKTEEINNMVSQLFYYSKMDMGNYPTEAERLNLAQELTDYVAASQEDYRAKGLVIHISELPRDTFILADPLQLRSVFANLLGNSAKYKIKETANAVIRCAVNGRMAQIIFEDDGPGVPEPALDRIFEAFYRTDPSRSNPQKGSGLGLAIAAKAIQRMGGKITAFNVPTGGLRLVIEIPSV